MRFAGYLNEMWSHSTILMVQGLIGWLYKPGNRLHLAKVLETILAIFRMEVTATLKVTGGVRTTTKRRPLKALGLMPWHLIPNEVIVINSYNFRTSQIPRVQSWL